jgi:hypothetical protein
MCWCSPLLSAPNATAGAGAAAVLMRDVVAHLGFVQEVRSTRGLRPQINALIEAGALVAVRQNGLDCLTLSVGGRRRVSRARRAGKLPGLPEAPQHRRWREARTAAGELIDALRGRLRGTLQEAGSLLDGEGHSDVWLALAWRLEQDASNLGRATYCLREWVEPDDAHADIEPAYVMGDPRRLRRRQDWRDTGGQAA